MIDKDFFKTMLVKATPAATAHPSTQNSAPKITGVQQILKEETLLSVQILSTEKRPQSLLLNEPHPYLHRVQLPDREVTMKSSFPFNAGAFLMVKSDGRGGFSVLTARDESQRLSMLMNAVQHYQQRALSNSQPGHQWIKQLTAHLAQLPEASLPATLTKDLKLLEQIGKLPVTSLSTWITAGSRYVSPANIGHNNRSADHALNALTLTRPTRNDIEPIAQQVSRLITHVRSFAPLLATALETTMPQILNNDPSNQGALLTRILKFYVQQWIRSSSADKSLQTSPANIDTTAAKAPSGFSLQPPGANIHNSAQSLNAYLKQGTETPSTKFSPLNPNLTHIDQQSSNMINLVRQRLNALLAHTGSSSSIDGNNKPGTSGTGTIAATTNNGPALSTPRNQGNLNDLIASGAGSGKDIPPVIKKTSTDTAESNGRKVSITAERASHQLQLPLNWLLHSLYSRLESQISQRPDAIGVRLQAEAERIRGQSDTLYSSKPSQLNTGSNLFQNVSETTRILENILSDLKNGIARQQHQVLSNIATALNSDPDQPQTTTIELPLVLPNLTTTPKLEIWQEHESSDSEPGSAKNAWRFRFFIEFTPLPPCCVDVTLVKKSQGDQGIDLTFWSLDAYSLQLFSEHQGHLETRLKNLGLEVTQCQSRRGMPEKAQKQMQNKTAHQGGIDITA